MTSHQDALRAQVYKFYSENLDKGKPFTVSHFEDEGVPSRTMYDILKRFEKEIPASRTTGSGRLPEKLPKRKLGTLKRSFDHKDTMSQRQAATKFNCHHTTIGRALKKLGVKARKKQRIPHREEHQILKAKTLCGRLFRKFSKRSWVIDDESYFTLSHSTIHGNNTFYTSNINNTPPSVKYSTKKKFEKKVLVWIAIGPNGWSEPLFKESGFAVNAGVYLQECIKRRLIPYIRAKYDQNYVFWPDLASAHYANVVVAHLKQQGINFVSKGDNPASVPEARSIEDFWGILKGRVYANAWRARTTQQLINRIRLCLRQMDPNLVQRLAEGTKKRIDQIRRNGVIETQ